MTLMSACTNGYYPGGGYGYPGGYGYSGGYGYPPRYGYPGGYYGYNPYGYYPPRPVHPPPTPLTPEQARLQYLYKNRDKIKKLPPQQRQQVYRHAEEMLRKH